MKPELQKKLFDQFPYIYGKDGDELIPFYFEVGDGWYDLIWELSTKLQAIIDKRLAESEYYYGGICKATQVKEKYGGLRFYITSGTQEIDDIIDHAENASNTICDVCGKQGTLNQGPWYEVRCEEHKTPRNGNLGRGQ